MTPITCRCCTQSKDTGQFRVLPQGSRLTKCRQCESADRQALKAGGRLNRLLRTWRGPVNPEPLRLTA